MLDVDGGGEGGSEEVRVYSLSTVGVSLQVGVGGSGAVPAVQNQNGFQVSYGGSIARGMGGVLTFGWCRILLRFGVRERRTEDVSDNTIGCSLVWRRKGIGLSLNEQSPWKIVKLNPGTPSQIYMAAIIHYVPDIFSQIMQYIH